MSRVLTSEAFMLVNGLDIQHSSEWEDYLEMNAQINGLTREEYAAYYLNTQWQMQCMESIVTLFEAKKVTRKQLDKALGEITRITQDLKSTVLLWKDAKENGNGAKEKEHLDTLKKLNAEKKEAEKEVEGFIKGLDKNVELSITEAIEVTKEMWDKEWPLKKVFGKDYEANFAKRVEAAMSKAKNEEQAEEWAYKNFKQLPNPAKGMTIEESVMNEYGPMRGSGNRDYSTSELVDRAGELDDIFQDSRNRRAIRDWEEYTEDLFGEYAGDQDGGTQDVYWADIPEHELQTAIDVGEDIMNKYKIKESVMNEAKGAPWPEQLEKGLTHWGYKKGTHTRELKTLPCRIGRNAQEFGGPNHAQSVVDLNMKDPMVKKFFKPKFKVRADGNYVNDYVELIPKKGYLYSLHVGTGQFEYFCLAIKPGEVYIFRKYDEAYGQYEYFKFEENMSTRSGVFDFKRHREEEQWKWNKLKPDGASHFVSVGWGIMDIGLEYTQLELPFEHLKTYESFVTEKKNLSSSIKAALKNGLVNVGGDKVKVSVTNKNQYKIQPYDSLVGGDWAEADLRDNFKDLVDDLNFSLKGKYSFSPIDVTNKEWIIELL